jgi:hypothetical protein
MLAFPLIAARAVETEIPDVQQPLYVGYNVHVVVGVKQGQPRAHSCWIDVFAYKLPHLFSVDYVNLKVGIIIFYF